MSSQASPTVLVASEDPGLLDEIVRHLEENPTWKLVTSAGTVADTVSAVESHLPDALIVSDAQARQLARDPNLPRPATIVVVGRQEQAAGLKAALKLGARGFVCWPKESSQLQLLVERAGAFQPSARTALGALHAVWAPKGGSGTSLIAAHLAACLAKVAEGCVLVDLDLDHADQTAILGAEGQSRNLSDLLRMGDELTGPIIESVAWPHPEGFKAILSPGSSGESGLVKGRDVARVLSHVREICPHVIADVPCGLNEVSLTVLEEAETVIMLVTPDLLSLKRARDALKVLRSSTEADSRFCLLLNLAGNPGVSEKDVEAILGLEISARVRADVQLYQAANRGQLSSSGKKMLARLARKVAKAAEPPAKKRNFRRAGSA